MVLVMILNIVGGTWNFTPVSLFLHFHDDSIPDFHWGKVPLLSDPASESWNELGEVRPWPINVTVSAREGERSTCMSSCLTLEARSLSLPPLACCVTLGKLLCPSVLREIVMRIKRSDPAGWFMQSLAHGTCQIQLS